MGAAVGDINNDGLPDLYLTNLGSNQMYLNKGGGKLLTLRKKAGLTTSVGAPVRHSLTTTMAVGWI